MTAMNSQYNLPEAMGFKAKPKMNSPRVTYWEHTRVPKLELFALCFDPKISPYVRWEIRYDGHFQHVGGEDALEAAYWFCGQSKESYLRTIPSLKKEVEMWKLELQPPADREALEKAGYVYDPYGGFYEGQEMSLGVWRKEGSGKGTETSTIWYGVKPGHEGLVWNQNVTYHRERDYSGSSVSALHL